MGTCLADVQQGIANFGVMLSFEALGLNLQKRASYPTAQRKQSPFALPNTEYRIPSTDTGLCRRAPLEQVHPASIGEQPGTGEC